MVECVTRILHGILIVLILLMMLIIYLYGMEELLYVLMEMEMVIEKIKEDQEGNEIIGYKFKPVKGEGMS